MIKMNEKAVVVYWDATALLSCFFRNRHSDAVVAKAREKGVHLLTTLAAAEVYTVLGRIRRKQVLAEGTVDALYELLENGPWSRLNIVPDSQALKELARRWVLGESGLWHLATAKTLQREFPELVLITFDVNLARASQGENLAVWVPSSGRGKKRYPLTERPRRG